MQQQRGAAGSGGDRHSGAPASGGGERVKRRRAAEWSATLGFNQDLDLDFGTSERDWSGENREREGRGEKIDGDFLYLYGI